MAVEHAFTKVEAVHACTEEVAGRRSKVNRRLTTFFWWFQALTAIRTLVEHGVLPELADVFEMADAWLKPHRP